MLLEGNVDPLVYGRPVADVGRTMVAKFGKQATVLALYSDWDITSGNRRPPVPGDANQVWRAEQTALLRSLSWLIQFQGEWL